MSWQIAGVSMDEILKQELLKIAGLALMLSIGLVIASQQPCFAEGAGPAVTEAKGAILTDSWGNVLYEKDADTPYPLASITKVMTAVVALDSGIPLDTPITIEEVEFDKPLATVSEVPAGTVMPLSDVLKVMLVYSANDFAYLVGKTVAGSEAAFCDLMNAKAADLGMTQTHFKNTHGLETEGHQSSARDLARLGRYALDNYPFIATCVSTEEVTVPVGDSEETFHSTDQLLGVYPGAMGIKTGSEEAGFTFLGAVRQANTALYSVVLGCPTDAGRWADTQAMWNWAYDNFEHRLLASPGLTIGRWDYPLRFGWDIKASSPVPTVGLVWPQGGMVASEKVMPANDFPVGGDIVGMGRWEQNGRYLGACVYRANRLVRDVEPALDSLHIVLTYHDITI